MSPLLKKKNRDPESLLLRKYCLISGGLAALVMLIMFILHDNSLLGGDQTVLRMDLYHQYGPLYAELYDRIVKGYSLTYSWTSGLGGAFLGNLFNYCSSPFALIMLLCGHKNMPEAIALMITGKAIFSSMSFTYYINKSTKSLRRMSIGFGLLYAFSGYFVAYSWNIMWLDAVAIFPLVILGIEYIIQKRKPGLYIFAMTYTMITNYYMAFMVCILSVIYFLFFYFSRYELRSQLRTVKPEPVPVPESVPAPEVGQTAAQDGVSEPFSEFTERLSTAAEAADDPDGLLNEMPFVQPESAPEVLSDTAFLADREGENESTLENFVATSDVQSAPVLTRRQAKKAKKAEKKRAKKEAPFTGSRFFRTGVTFAFCSVLCFLLAAFALLPVAYCLQSSSATSGSFPDNLKIYFNLFDFFANHLPGLTTTIRSSGDIVLPNVFCGTLTLILLPLYFFSNRVSGRRKIVFAIVLVLFYLSFSMNNVNYIWHGLHMPNDLPFRYSFGYSFILLAVAYQVYLNLGEFNRKVYIGVGFALIAFIALVQKTGQQNIGTVGITTSLICVILYVVMIGFLLSEKYYEKRISVIVICVILFEIVLGDCPNIVMEQDKDAYVSDYDDYQQISTLTEQDEQELFYRTELTKLRARMDPCWYGYNGTSTFSSMAYEPVAKLLKKLGMFGNDINSYTYYPQTPVFNTFFGLRYLYDKDDLIRSGDYYKEIGSNDTFTSYEYKYFMPIAFAVDDKLEDFEANSDDPFIVQNDFIEKATGVSDVLEIVEATAFDADNVTDVAPATINAGLNFAFKKSSSDKDGKATVILDVEKEGTYYVYAGSTKVSNVTVKAEDYEYSYSSSSIQPFTLDVGYQPEGAKIRVSYTLDENDEATVAFTAARLDPEKFEEAYKKLNEGGKISLETFDGPEFSGKITVKGEDKLLYTSVPYDESWTITVDGERVSYSSDRIVKIGDALIGVRLDKGEHDVAFSYQARGLSTGIKLSLLGAAILIFMFVLRYALGDRLPGKFARLKSEYYPDNCID